MALFYYKEFMCNTIINSIRIGFLICMMAFLQSCSDTEEKLFTDVSSATGIDFANNIEETEQLHVLNFEYMYNGAGVAVGDVNNDGLADIYFTANQTYNKLYLNKGNLQFEDITETAGVAGRQGWKTGVSMADVNGDNLPDIYVCYSGKGDKPSRNNQLFINQGVKNGKPSFIDKAAEYGIEAPGSNSTQAAFFDYDRDGDLDMFLLNHATSFYSPFFNTSKLRNKRHPYFSNYLFRNDGGHFTDVSEQAGIKGGGNNFGLGVAVSDINNDGWPDLYYTNDYEEQDFLLLNNHDGTFTDVTNQSIAHISKYGMGCDVADYNNDGLMDIVVLDMLPEDNRRQKLLRGPDEYDKYNLLVDSGYFHQNMRNTLQLNDGMNENNTPVFSEIGQLANISNTDWSWAPLLADFDNDGFKDLFVTNGYWRDYTNMDFLAFGVEEHKKSHPGQPLGYDLVKQMPQTKISNYIFKNNGNLQFENKSKEWGIAEPLISNGAAYADLDNDGDLDLIVNNIGSKASVYRNNSEKNKSNHFLRIQLQDTGYNRFATGAKVSIEDFSGAKQYVEMQPVRGFQSSVEPLIHFGLGKDSLIKKVVVRWPDGGYSTINNVKANTTLRINKAEMAVDSTGNDPVKAKPLFTDYTAQSGINFIQKENVYVDFKNEFLLPWQLSREGPRLAKADVNGDGLEDIFIGAPMGQAAQLYLQTAGEKFTLSPSQPWKQDSLCEDIQSVFFDVEGDGDMDLYLVSGGNEPHSNSTALQDRLYINDGKGNFAKRVNTLPVITTSKSCVAVADYNKDGKPDVFVGGRVVPGKYGLTPESYLLQNESSGVSIRFTNRVAADATGLQFAGMVTDAVWIDINKDEWLDLIVVGEWMPVKIFINNKGKLEEKSSEYGLLDTGGLWTRIIPGDMDNDGDTDFLLGNLAPNTQLRASAKEPMTLCVNDFMKNGVSVPVLCYYIQGVSYPYASRDEIAEPMPGLKKKFLRYATYATTTVKDIFSAEQLKGMKELYVHTVKNCWLQNQGNGKFIVKELPVMAQFSAIQGAVMNDFNQDGKNEIFAAGNFYPFRVQLGREDAGKGILLKYDKDKAGFTVAGFSETGAMADGDTRDMIEVKTRTGKAIIVIAKNNDRVQVIRTN